MTVHIMCLTTSGGIPLFVRKKGDGDLVKFSDYCFEMKNIQLIYTICFR